MTNVEILEKAAELIEERGLAHGEYQDSFGRLCAYGALNVARGLAPDDLTKGELEDTLDAAVCCWTQHSFADDWNDDSEQDEVVGLLRDLADKLKEPPK